ncbi:alkaline phosphatase [bacterium]|nr:alkaline phosphatase [bacterium]
MNSQRLWFCAILFLISSFAYAQQPDNLILFIGDGMGQAHVDAARIYKGGSSTPLAMDQLPQTGKSRTYSTSHFVTDSAAAATALACAAKTYNGGIGVTDPAIDPTHEARSLQNITQLALAAGKKVGLISTTRVTHATPACFYAHQSSRGDETAIADQILSSGLTLLLGGGRTYFHGTNWRDPEDTATTGVRTDGRDLVDELAREGWSYVQSRDDLTALNPGQSGQRVLGLFSASYMQYEADRAGDKFGEPSLAEMTEFAIRSLQYNPNGYFLMIEAGRIDHASHAGDGARMVADTLALDDAVARARALASPLTLIVVTADHETGGLALHGSGARLDVKGPALLSSIKWATTEHTAVSVPIMAAGPAAETFTGTMENHELGRRLAQALGLSFTDPINVEYGVALENALHGSIASVKYWPLKTQ